MGVLRYMKSLEIKDIQDYINFCFDKNNNITDQTIFITSRFHKIRKEELEKMPVDHFYKLFCEVQSYFHSLGWKIEAIEPPKKTKIKNKWELLDI